MCAAQWMAALVSGLWPIISGRLSSAPGVVHQDFWDVQRQWACPGTASCRCASIWDHVRPLSALCAHVSLLADVEYSTPSADTRCLLKRKMLWTRSTFRLV
jgi:hypothetical protein